MLLQKSVKMSNRIYERFVECPGVIEIRWVSDDPDHHKTPEDMYNCQNNGIPEDYGKKDKRTTEQAHFYCCVCECQSASLKTLRAHCEVIIRFWAICLKLIHFKDSLLYLLYMKIGNSTQKKGGTILSTVST